MFYKFFDIIRAKPKAVRDQYALGIAVLCTVLIAGVWSLSLPSRFTTTSLAAAGAASSTSPFSGLIGQIKKQFAGAKEKIEPVPVVVTAPSIASSTTDALELQLSDETKAAIESGTTSLRFSDATFGTTTTETVPSQTILIATSARATSTSE